MTKEELQEKLISNLRQQIKMQDKEINSLNDKLYLINLKLNKITKLLGAYQSGTRYVKDTRAFDKELKKFNPLFA